MHLKEFRIVVRLIQSCLHPIHVSQNFPIMSLTWPCLHPIHPSHTCRIYPSHTCTGWRVVQGGGWYRVIVVQNGATCEAARLSRCLTHCGTHVDRAASQVVLTCRLEASETGWREMSGSTMVSDARSAASDMAVALTPPCLKLIRSRKPSPLPHSH